MATSIRLKKDGTLRRPTVTGRGQLSVPASGTALKCALWRRKLQQVIGPTGEVDAVTALAFVPAGTDVERRDQLTVGTRVYVVLEVIPGEDDRAVEDHIGLQLQELG